MNSLVNPYHQAGQTTSAYADVRPGYPKSLLAPLLATLTHSEPGITGHRRPHVVDIGAGTGKLTRELVGLVGRDTAISAVEPSADMRATLRAVLDHTHVHIRDTAAEATGLASSSCDIVFFAQSWHWVDPVATQAEMSRILRPGGTLVTISNQLDVSIPWVKRLSRIMRSGDVQRRTSVPDVGPNFTQPQLQTAYWQDRLSVAEVYQLGTTRASWLTSTPENRHKMRENLRWYLTENLGYRPENTVELPYVTYMWTAQRVGAEKKCD